MDEQAPHETRELNLPKFGWRGLPNAELMRSVPNISAERATHGLVVGNHAVLFFDAPPRLNAPLNPLSASLSYLFAASIFHIADFRFLGIWTLEKTSFSEDLVFCRFTPGGTHVQFGRDPALKLQIVFESEVVKRVCADQNLDFRTMKWIPLSGSGDA